MQALDTRTRLSFAPVAAPIGVRVDGISLDQEPTADVMDQLRESLHEHGVLIFEFGRPIEPNEFDNFARLFGEREPVYGFSTKSADASAGLIDATLQPLKQYRTNMWHSDGTPFERPPQAAMLMAVQSPDVGGGTMWSSMYAAYEALSSHYQRLLDGLEVVHSTMRTPFVKQQTETTHPAIIRDPVSGKKLLFVNSVYSERFVGLNERENESLLQFLFEHVNTPEFHVTVTWKPGTIAVWEERATQHRSIDAFTGSRKLRRITFKGEKPSA